MGYAVDLNRKNCGDYSLMEEPNNDIIIKKYSIVKGFP